MRRAKVIDLPVAMHHGMETDQEQTRHATAIAHVATHLATVIDQERMLPATVIDQEPTHPAMAMHQRGIDPGMERRGTGMRPETVSLLSHERRYLVPKLDASLAW